MFVHQRSPTIHPIGTHKLSHIDRSSKPQNRVIESIRVWQRLNLSERNVERARPRRLQVTWLDHEDLPSRSKFPSKNLGAGGVSASLCELDPTPLTTRGGYIIIASPIALRARHAGHAHRRDDYCTTGAQATKQNQDCQARHDQQSTGRPP